MEWQEQFNKSIDYIEAHLETYPDGNMSNAGMIEEASRITGSSSHDYQRVFSTIVGIPPGEYIRRRRLTLAAAELRDGVNRITETAFKYGYESPEAFSRAFKALHGKPPSSARTGGIKIYPRMSIQLNVKKDTDIECRIIEKEAFELIGISSVIGGGIKDAFTDVPSFWTACDRDGTLNSLNSLLGRPRYSCLHAAAYGHTRDSFRYMICMYKPMLKGIPGIYEQLCIPAGTWAVFTVPDNEVMPVWNYAYARWLPGSGYRHAQSPGLEMYYGNANHGNVFSELWMPVYRKEKDGI